MNRLTKLFQTLLALFVLSSCSSGEWDDDGIISPPPVTNSYPTDVWQVTFVENGVSVFGLTDLVEGNQKRFISNDGGTVYARTISVSGASFTATTTNFRIDGTVFLTVNMTGTDTTKSIISGTYTSSNESSGSFSLAYNSVTDKNSFSAITDINWTELSTSVISIDSTGAVTGVNASGCVFLGTISMIDSTVNIYNLSLSVSSCDAFNGTYAGYIFISDTGS